MTLSANAFANDGDNELFQAIKTQQWTDAETLLTARPELARQQDVFGNLPLHSAIGFKMPDRLTLRLLSVYPEACQVHGTDDWLPLHVAAMWGVSAPVLEALIAAHPDGLDDTGQASNKGRSPRHFSGRFAHNRHLLERSTEEWKQIIEVAKCDEEEKSSD